MDNVSNAKTSGKFQDFVNASAIICRSSAATSENIINELIEVAVKNNPQLDIESVRKGVFEREAMFPTVIAPGLAMPHARVSNLDKLIVALATIPQGVRFGSEEDGENVKVAVLVLSPADNPTMHLHVVSALAREFSDLSKIDQLAELNSINDIVGFFGIMPMRLPDYLKVGDLANGIGPILLADDSLAFAFRKFAESRSAKLPVMDNEGSLLGVIMLEDILRYNLPKDLLLAEDWTALYNFQPFAKMLAAADQIKVSDIMQSDCEKVCEDLPAGDLVKIFLNTHARELLVVDSQGRLRGEITMRDFCAKIFWE
ncbi:MAG: CBS domain-containing protein [Lentisphaerae bacterium]|nr:CBS domain-containing protein [Lentisphaerota bacterium]